MKTMTRQQTLFEIPVHRLDRARTLLMQIRDRVRWSSAKGTGVTVTIDRSNLILLDEMIDLLDDVILFHKTAG